VAPKKGCSAIDEDLKNKKEMKRKKNRLDLQNIKPDF
jgi:hypothetical protein